jgi:hypothetical protein
VTQVRMIVAAAFALLLIGLFLMTYFTVDQNEMTVVTRFGHLEYVADPGLHFEIPFVNGIQAYRTDIQAIHPDKGVNTYTVDNQEVDVVYTVFYRIPADKVAYIYTTTATTAPQSIEKAVNCACHYWLHVRNAAGWLVRFRRHRGRDVFGWRKWLRSVLRLATSDDGRSRDRLARCYAIKWRAHPLAIRLWPE